VGDIVEHNWNTKLILSHCRSLSSYIPYHPFIPSLSFLLYFTSHQRNFDSRCIHYIPTKDYSQSSTLLITSFYEHPKSPIATMSYPVTPSIEKEDMMASPRIQSADSPPMSPQMEQADIQSKQTTGMSPTLHYEIVKLTISGVAGIHPIVPTDTPSDLNIPDNYVSATIAKQKYLPPVTWSNLIYNIQWISFLAITVTPSLAIYGMFTTPYNRNTLIWR